MNKLILGLFLAISTVAFAGDGDYDCYDAYSKKFEERGANKVKDGWYENVVITFRQAGNSECVLGKVQVEKGAVTQIYLKNMDGTYQIYTKHFKHDEKAVISNGISKSKITVDGVVVNVIFVKSIKPPKKKIATAPSPDDL